MEKQQTAVEYLFKTLSHYYKGMEKSYNPLFEKAKQMEKEQKVESYKNGYANGQTDAFSN